MEERKHRDRLNVVVKQVRGDGSSGLRHLAANMDRSW
jgi:hypothetical protein